MLTLRREAICWSPVFWGFWGHSLEPNGFQPKKNLWCRPSLFRFKKTCWTPTLNDTQERKKNVWSQFVELALVVQLNNCHTIPQVSQTTSYQKDLWRKKNVPHNFLFVEKKQENKRIPIWSLYHPQWIQWIIIALDNTGTLVVGSRLLAGQPMKDLGYWAVFSGEPHDWTLQFAIAKTMRLHQATRHLCNYDESMYTPLSVRSSHDLRVPGQVGLAHLGTRPLDCRWRVRFSRSSTMGQKSSRTWDIEHLVMWDKAISKQPVFSVDGNGDIFLSIFPLSECLVHHPSETTSR